MRTHFKHVSFPLFFALAFIAFSSNQPCSAAYSSSIAELGRRGDVTIDMANEAAFIAHQCGIRPLQQYTAFSAVLGSIGGGSTLDLLYPSEESEKTQESTNEQEDELLSKVDPLPQEVDDALHEHNPEGHAQVTQTRQELNETLVVHNEIVGQPDADPEAVRASKLDVLKAIAKYSVMLALHLAPLAVIPFVAPVVVPYIIAAVAVSFLVHLAVNEQVVGGLKKFFSWAKQRLTQRQETDEEKAIEMPVIHLDGEVLTPERVRQETDDMANNYEFSEDEQEQREQEQRKRRNREQERRNRLRREKELRNRKQNTRQRNRG